MKKPKNIDVISDLSAEGYSQVAIAQKLGISKQAVNQKINSYKAKARQRLTDAVKRGDIKRSDACEACDMEGLDIEAHHPDYNEPLTVLWMCTLCHAGLHKAMRSQKQ